MVKRLYFILSLSTSLSVLGITGCFNPFFPETGGVVQEPLTTPEKTISALSAAYETSNLQAFQALIWDKYEYRSYVAFDDLNYTDGLTHLPQYQVRIDTVLSSVYIPAGQSYLELNWAQEEGVHAKLLNSRNELSFATPLTVLGTDYVLDSTGSFVDYAVVTVFDTELRIIVAGDTLSPFAITGQRFALREDLEGNWKIWKWIELN